MTECSSPFLHAYLLDRRGGGREIDAEQVGAADARQEAEQDSEQDAEHHVPDIGYGEQHLEAVHQ